MVSHHSGRATTDIPEMVKLDWPWSDPIGPEIAVLDLSAFLGLAVDF